MGYAGYGSQSLKFNTRQLILRGRQCNICFPTPVFIRLLKILDIKLRTFPQKY